MGDGERGIHIGNSRRRGDSTAKSFKAKYVAKVQFPEGWGRGSEKKIKWHIKSQLNVPLRMHWDAMNQTDFLKLVS